MSEISKPKRTRLTLGQQVEVVRKLQNGDDAAQIMRAFGIGKRTVFKIRSNSESILEQAEKGSQSLDSKSSRSCQFPEIEKGVNEFVAIVRAHKMPVTCAALKARAEMLRDAAIKSCSNDTERKKLEKFTVSKGWVSNFMKRHSIRTMSFSEEGDIGSAQEVAKDMADLREKLNNFSANNIFNVDETGLFFKLLPRKTYICDLGDRKSVRGTKAMSSKDRVTAYVCTNAAGKKVDMCMIGKAKEPRCFRIQKPPIRYLHQENAWSDAPTFKQWFETVFIPYVRRHSSTPIALVMGNCGPHGTDIVDPDGQISIFTLPPNFTAIHQPLDVGIISSWKANYRQLLIKEIVENIETRQTRRDSNKALKAGMRGLDEGHDPHMLDVLNLAMKSWNDVSEVSICQCWIKSHMLPQGMIGELKTTVESMENVSNDCDLKEVVSQIAKLNLELDRRDPFYDQVRDVIDESIVQKWLNIEVDTEILEALIADAAQAVQPIESNGDHTEVDQQDNNEVENGSRKPLPSTEVIFERLNKLDEIATNSKVSEAAYHLKMLRSVFSRAKEDEMKGA